MSKKYNLTEAQLKGLANLCHQEQGSVQGAAAEASLICNRFENFGLNYGNVYNYARNCGWFAKAAHHMDNGSSSPELVEAVRDVICNGNRTIPDYIDEHDCFSDIVSISTGDVYEWTDYVKNKTVIKNTYGAKYTFWCFPDTGCDPFGYTGKIPKEEEVMPVMGVAEKSCTWMETMAADDAHHGYDQEDRWGEYGDYDCSSAIITAVEQAGIPVKSKGRATYTGNMKRAFLQCGYEDVTAEVNLKNGAGCLRGDVLLNERNHTAMYCGNGVVVDASINEYGRVTGGSTGDQTGREFWKHPYYNYPWDCVLRYKEKETMKRSGYKKGVVRVAYVRLNYTGAMVSLLQFLLNLTENAGLTIDGIFGQETDRAVRAFQEKNNISVTGICNVTTFRYLMRNVVKRTYK